MAVPYVSNLSDKSLEMELNNNEKCHKFLILEYLKSGLGVNLNYDISQDKFTFKHYGHTFILSFECDVQVATLLVSKTS